MGNYFLVAGGGGGGNSLVSGVSTFLPNSSSSFKPNKPLIGPLDESPFPPPISTSGIIFTFCAPMLSITFSWVKLSPPIASTARRYDSALDLPLAKIASASALPVTDIFSASAFASHSTFSASALASSLVFSASRIAALPSSAIFSAASIRVCCADICASLCLIAFSIIVCIIENV